MVTVISAVAGIHKIIEFRLSGNSICPIETFPNLQNDTFQDTWHSAVIKYSYVR
jgi:hypothetical protein